MQTEHRLIPTDEPLLFTRGHPSGKFAGQSSAGRGNIEYQEAGGSGVVVGDGYGENTSLYLRDGTLIQGARPYGSQGLRYQADDGSVVTGDQSHLSPDGLLADYTELHNIRVGQDQIAGRGALVQVLDRPGGTGPRYILESGDCQFIRYTFYPPNLLAVYVVKLPERQAVAFWFTLEEIATLPPYPAAPVVQPAFHFLHPVSVYPLFAAGSGLPDLRSLGEYTEGAFPTAPPPRQRVILVHDGISDWTPPPTLRPWDLVGVEWYRDPSETLQRSVMRWAQQTLAVLASTNCLVVGIPMFYDQLRWTVQQILDGLAHLSDIVNLSRRIALVAPFAYDRANGIRVHPELQVAFRNLVAAADQAGAATLVPIPGPTPPPTTLHEEQIMATPQVSGIIHYASKKPSSQAGCSNYILPSGRVFSCQGDGSAGDRDPGTDGPWEQGQESGALTTFRAGGALYTWLLAPVDKLPG